MKTPIPMILLIGLGAAMMALGGKKSNPVEDDEIPTSLDYNDPDLHDALESSEEDDE